MDSFLHAFERALPACLSFGPLFMIMVARDDTDRRTRSTRALNYAGLGMLIFVLMWLNFTLIRARDAASQLEQRVGYLEEAVRSLKR